MIIDSEKINQINIDKLLIFGVNKKLAFYLAKKDKRSLIKICLQFPNFDMQ